MKHTFVGAKAILKGWKSGLFVNFGQFPDPDSQGGSRRAISMRIQADPETLVAGV
jgi:hypothetical protein